MMKRLAQPFGLLVLVWALLPLAAAQAAAPPSLIAGELQPFVDNHTLAGAVTLVASRQRLLSLEAVGYADIAAKRPMRTDCLFWIASMSKPITATALMILVDEGNKLTDAEKAAGWKLLFDGKTFGGWRNFRKPDVSPGWQVIDGALCRVAKSAGDLITTGQYDNFELEMDYKVPPHANSGIMYRVSEDEARAPLTGVECQILDNTDPKGDSQKAGWAYGLYQPPVDPKTGKPLDATRPVGQWNHVRLVCRGPHVEHWMNGVKYCQYEIGSADWNRRVVGTKFEKWPKFAKNKTGHVALQGDHGDVSFANIKLRPLPDQASHNNGSQQPRHLRDFG